MKKLFVILAVAAALGVSAAAHAAVLKSFGIRAEVPAGWSCAKGDSDEVMIYNKAESAAVIIDPVKKEDGKSAQSLAQDMADAVGVKKNEIRRDSSGAINMDFMQGDEQVSVRVVEESDRILMIYMFGGSAEVRRIARSVVSDGEGEQAAGAAAPMAEAEQPVRP